MQSLSYFLLQFYQAHAGLVERNSSLDQFLFSVMEQYDSFSLPGQLGSSRAGLPGTLVNEETFFRQLIDKPKGKSTLVEELLATVTKVSSVTIQMRYFETLFTALLKSGPMGQFYKAKVASSEWPGYMTRPYQKSEKRGSRNDKKVWGSVSPFVHGFLPDSALLETLRLCPALWEHFEVYARKTINHRTLKRDFVLTQFKQYILATPKSGSDMGRGAEAFYKTVCSAMAYWSETDFFEGELKKIEQDRQARHQKSTAKNAARSVKEWMSTSEELAIIQQRRQAEDALFVAIENEIKFEKSTSDKYDANLMQVLCSFAHENFFGGVTYQWEHLYTLLRSEAHNVLNGIDGAERHVWNFLKANVQKKYADDQALKVLLPVLLDGIDFYLQQTAMCDADFGKGTLELMPCVFNDVSFTKQAEPTLSAEKIKEIVAARDVRHINKNTSLKSKDEKAEKRRKAEKVLFYALKMAENPLKNYFKNVVDLLLLIKGRLSAVDAFLDYRISGAENLNPSIKIAELILFFQEKADDDYSVIEWLMVNDGKISNILDDNGSIIAQITRWSTAMLCLFGPLNPKRILDLAARHCPVYLGDIVDCYSIEALTKEDIFSSLIINGQDIPFGVNDHPYPFHLHMLVFLARDYPYVNMQLFAEYTKDPKYFELAWRVIKPACWVQLLREEHLYLVEDFYLSGKSLRDKVKERILGQQDIGPSSGFIKSILADAFIYIEATKESADISPQVLSIFTYLFSLTPEKLACREVTTKYNLSRCLPDDVVSVSSKDLISTSARSQYTRQSLPLISAQRMKSENDFLKEIRASYPTVTRNYVAAGYVAGY